MLLVQLGDPVGFRLIPMGVENNDEVVALPFVGGK